MEFPRKAQRFIGLPGNQVLRVGQLIPASRLGITRSKLTCLNSIRLSLLTVRFQSVCHDIASGSHF